jgi:uncharacterized protein YdaU (DUF1376 family)
MKPSPAFQFYPSDWLSSQRVQMMTLEEEGAYIRLIASCWQHGSIPADPERCARLLGKGGSTTLATVVQAMFQPDPNDRTKLVHDRLLQEREKQKTWREKSAAGGKKSAEKRAEKAKNAPVSPSVVKGGSRVVEPPYQPNGNSSSSSSSSISTESLTLPFASKEFEEAWKKWQKHRVELKKKLTPTMMESQFSDMLKMGEKRAIAMIHFTVSKGWQGLREECDSGFGSFPTVNKPKYQSCL